MGNQQPSLEVGSKVCRVCEKRKSIDSFRLLHNRGRVYRSNRCLICEAAENREYHQRNKARYRENMRRFRKLNPEHVRAQGRKWAKVLRERQRAQVYAAYGGKCQCCGETEPLFLNIDHVNNDGRHERKLKPQGTLYARLIRAAFPSRYQLLCYNCNLGKHRNGGICPHQKGSTTIPSGSTSQAIGDGSAKRPRGRPRRTKI